MRATVVMAGATRTAIPFRVAQRNLLGHELADHQGEVGDDGHHEADADCFGDARAQPQLDEPFRQTLADGGPGERAREHPDQGNAHLHRRQEPTRIGRERKRAARADHVAVDQRLQPAAPGRDDGELRKRQQAVDEHQGDHDRQFDEQHRRNINMSPHRREPRR
jgi:hypothetical protein